MAPCWRTLAHRAAGLAYCGTEAEHHAAPLWLLAGDWQAARESVEEIDSWWRIAPRSSMQAAPDGSELNQVGDWLVVQGVAKPWLHAPCLIGAGILQEELGPLAVVLSKEQFSAAIHWLASTVELNALMEDIRVGSVRISEIIRAMKSYSRIDLAPQQEVDIHEGIEDTLIIMQHRLKQGITVQRDYDRSLPPLTVCANS